MTTVEYCDTHPTARATVVEARLGLTFCGHCAQKHEGNPKLVLVPLNAEAVAVAK